MTINAITQEIIGKSIKVHTQLGPGLLENAYKECLYYELLQSELKVEKEKPMPLIYEKVKLDCGYRVDLFVENKYGCRVKGC